LASYLEPKDKTFKFVYNSKIYEKARESSIHFCEKVEDLLKNATNLVG
jgi:hypothetical protein